MNTNHTQIKRTGITFKTALLSWLVTIVTLLIFVTAIIPQQKEIFLQNLNSKALGVAESSRSVVAGAVVNGDYSAVVEHCLGVLEGDKSIDYLVITKNDGESQIFQQQNPKWDSGTLDAKWRPEHRITTSQIGIVPMFNRRVFHYSQPFDYSSGSIKWGWIHVGLSLESYDRNVAEVFRRTTILAVFCVVLSLVASVIYAKQLVRPILSLRTIVQKVAAGDLSARAVIESGDEVGSLAGSFNAMTEALRQRDDILQSVGFAAQQFLSTTDWRHVIGEVLHKIGRAAQVSRAYVFENHLRADGALLTSLRYEWTAGDITPQIQNPDLQSAPWRECGLEDWASHLSQGEIISGPVREMSPAARRLLEPQQIQSLILVPIIVEHTWWGFLGLDECQRERIWTPAEKDSLRAAADMLSAAVARQRTQDALVEAKETLEQRVSERTQELREQVEAKERARAELAEAQQRLVEISRQSGMAEVATGVLHNVGNVLNSVNVSVTLVHDSLRRSGLRDLGQAVGLLREHEADLSQFLAGNPKGQVILGYLSQLSEALIQENEQTLAEVKSIARNVEHIKEIVAMQQSYAQVSGVRETLSVAQLVDDALHIHAPDFQRHHITVIRRYETVPPISVEKHKVLQILINILRNAKYALAESSVPARRMEIRIARIDEQKLGISVVDNGVGISPENLTRVFQHGFTTRKQGHGFGLHSGALAAKEMGGSLKAFSDGVGQGAIFVLELPLSPPKPVG